MNAVLHVLAPYQGAALILVAYLVASLLIGAAVTMFALLVVRCWKPVDAAGRYAVWYVALIAVLLGPLAATVAIEHAHHAPPTADAVAAALRAAIDAHPNTTPLTLTALRERGPRPEIALPPAVAYGAAGLWLLVVLAGAARFVAGAFVLARLKRDALPLGPEFRAALPLWSAHAAASRARAVRLCVSDRVDVPVAVGLFDGMVVVPQAVLDDFEPGDVDRFVLHELAHLDRRDDWTAVVQRVVQIVLFFNPAVHVIARQLDLEREIACDDRVIAATSDVRSYAFGLTRMAESTAWPHRGIAAPAIFGTRKQLSLRVEQLLAGRRLATRRFATAPAALALAASLGVCAAAAPLAPSIGLSDPRDAVPHVAEFRTTAVLYLRRDGETTPVDSKRSATVVLRADARTIHEELRRAGPLTSDDLATLIDDLKRHGTNARVVPEITSTPPPPTR